MADNTSKLDSLKILLGVSGGIAAYKAVALASKLTGAGSTVKTVTTASACELIRPKSFEAVTGQQVYTNLWNGPEEYEIGHVSLAEWAEIIVLAPATANIIGKIANGICDDLLSTMLCAGWNKKTLIAPAMNNNMWENPAVQQNIQKLKEGGAELVGPATGRLACGTEAIGRMAEPEDIVKAIKSLASK